MHVLVVFCHPRRESFTGALLDGLVSGLAEADHEVELADLYREGFDPRFRAEDYAQFKSEPMPEEIVAEQRRLDRADALAFVFPVWWWSFPAMLKGWSRRVWPKDGPITSPPIAPRACYATDRLCCWGLRRHAPRPTANT